MDASPPLQTTTTTYWDRALIRVIDGPDKGRRGVVTGIAADTLTVLELPYRNLFFVNTCDVKKID